MKKAVTPDVQKKIRGDEGNIVKFGTTWLPPTDNNKIFNGLIVRQDWLDKYNLEAPVTLDDYTNVLRTFKENGVQIPLALCEFNQAQFSANNPICLCILMFSHQGVLTWTMTEIVHYSRTQDGYKEVCFPVTAEFREQLYQAVLDAYQQAITQVQTPPAQMETAPQEAPQPGQQM